MTKFRVSVVLTIVTDYVTYAPNLALFGRNPLPGGIGHQPLGTTTGARLFAGLGQVGAGNARSTDRPTLAATSQEAKAWC
jgi:hypothetical protein